MLLPFWLQHKGNVDFEPQKGKECPKQRETLGSLGVIVPPGGRAELRGALVVFILFVGHETEFHSQGKPPWKQK